MATKTKAAAGMGAGLGGKSKLAEIGEFGQSVWLDYIQRGLIRGGGLAELVRRDGVSGVTSNPAIFEKAIASTKDYDGDIRLLAGQGKSASEIFRALSVGDIQEAADVLREVYDATGGRDGYVSIEVSPHLAYDSKGTMREARELWGQVNRPNVLIKIPGTKEGLAAIREAIGAGINVNVTLLFSVARYREVAEAYLGGLEDLSGRGVRVDGVTSVASFFISRIDVLVDSMLEKQAGEGKKDALKLRGQAAVACAKRAYQVYHEVFGSERFKRLAGKGAKAQRLLWASTSTKNPSYQDVMYVEPLIGSETVNTMPVETIEAYRDHGRPAARLEEGLKDAERVLGELGRLGIDLEAAAKQLEDEGVQKFIKPFDSLLKAIGGKC